MKVLPVFLLLISLVVLVNATFRVAESQQVIITRFGKPVGQPINTPGLKFKVPVIDTVHQFDKRFLEWDGKVNEVPTREKRFILVDTYARWQITDPLLFFQRLKDEESAKRRLDGILNGETRDAVARHSVQELVRSSNREPLEDPTQHEEEEGIGLAKIQKGRGEIASEILTNSQKRVGDLGIEILDVQIKRINYVEEVRRTVYERMIAERTRIADRFRSEGQGEALRIRGDKERDLKEISSEAYRQAQEIIGEADAEATQIYAQAYNQSADSRRFYQFLKSMETMSKTIDKETSMVLSTDGEFYRYLENGGR